MSTGGGRAGHVSRHASRSARLSAELLIAQREMAAAQSQLTAEITAHSRTRVDAAADASRMEYELDKLRAAATPKRRSKGQRPDDQANVLAWLSGRWREVVYRARPNPPDWDLWYSMPEDPKLDPVEELQLENARLKQQLAEALVGVPI